MRNGSLSWIKILSIGLYEIPVFADPDNQL
jgi:hypothetical protein